MQAGGICWAIMEDPEHEQFEDDDIVEISDILEAEGTSKDVPAPKLQPRSFPLRLLPHRHSLQLAITMSAIVLILFIIFGSSASVRNMISGPAPTATATLGPGVDLFYIASEPRWGSFSIDGHSILHLPKIGSDAPLSLGRGHHRIEWRVDSFALQSCVVSVPPQFGTDTCHYNSAIPLQLGLSAWVITFYESLNTLPPQERTALIDKAQTAANSLQSSETVLPGEQYVDIQSSASVDTAIRPLRATLRFSLDTSFDSPVACVIPGLGSSCTSEGQDCRLFCPVPESIQSLSLPAQEWAVFAVIEASWDFATLDGKGVASSEPDSFGSGIGNEHLVELDITRDEVAGWHVTIAGSNPLNRLLPDPACASAADEIASTGEFGETGGNVEENVTWQFISGPNSAAGCLAIGTPLQDTTDATPQPMLPKAYLLHRFGVDIAANEAADSYWGFLPMADAYEQHLAQHLATLAAQNATSYIGNSGMALAPVPEGRAQGSMLFK